MSWGFRPALPLTEVLTQKEGYVGFFFRQSCPADWRDVTETLPRSYLTNWNCHNV